MNEDLIKCPHCGFEDDPCSFPDLYCEFEEKAEYREQYKLQDLAFKTGYNVVTCGMCGGTIITRSQENERK